MLAVTLTCRTFVSEGLSLVFIFTCLGTDWYGLLGHVSYCFQPLLMSNNKHLVFLLTHGKLLAYHYVAFVSHPLFGKMFCKQAENSLGGDYGIAFRQCRCPEQP